MSVVDHEHDATTVPEAPLAPAEFRESKRSTSWPTSRVVDHRRTKLLLLALDLIVVAAAMLLAVVIASAVEVWRVGDQNRHILIGAASLFTWAAAFVHFRLYQARFVSTRTQELRRLAKAVLVGLASLAVINAVVGGDSLRRAWLVTTGIAAIVGLAAEREIVRRLFSRLRRQGRRLRRVVVVGCNREAHELRKSMEQDTSLGFEFVGFLALESTTTGEDILGVAADALQIVQEHDVGHVMVAGSATELHTTKRLARQLLRNGIHVELSPTLPDITAERLTVRPFGRFPVMYLEPYNQNGWRAVAKRCFDTLLALLGLIVLSPAMALTALAVRLDSPGAVFYRQERVGQHGRRFNVVKFRSMVTDAHAMRDELTDLNEADGPLFKVENDPRITRVGRFIRKTSIDELPQLWNVLFGDMGLVGPRPALPEEAEQWSPELRDRLRVKPGITGMWQVSGRSSTSFDEYSRLDLYYVDNWSLTTDLSILVRTIPAVFKGRGAS